MIYKVHTMNIFLPMKNQRTIGPENARLKPDLGAFRYHEMTLTLNTHTPQNANALLLKFE